MKYIGQSDKSECEETGEGCRIRSWDIGWCQETIPRHLMTIDDAEMLKKVVLHSVATAFASIVYKNRNTLKMIGLSF